MDQYNHKSWAIAVLLITTVLTACGGGSSGSGGGSGTAQSSSIVVDLSSNSARLNRPEEQLDGATRFAIMVRDLAIRNAWAQQMAGVEVFIDGESAGFTDAAGTFAKAVPPGKYTVCLNDPRVPTNCMMNVQVGDNQVVVITGTNLNPETGVATFESIMVESAFDNLALFESDKGHKVYMCHKGKTINVAKSSVGTSRSVRGHQAHGDTPGACNTDAEAANSTSPGNSGKDDKGNNGKGNDNRCNKGNKDKKNCDNVNQEA